MVHDLSLVVGQCSLDIPSPIPRLRPRSRSCACSKMCLVEKLRLRNFISRTEIRPRLWPEPHPWIPGVWHSSKRSCVMRRIVHAETGMPVRSPKSSRGAAVVAMMQATNLREGDNVSRGGCVYGARFRTILVKREMGSGLVMILKIRRQNPAQLALIEDDDVIETFAAD